jgi:hypothetical protein
VGPYSPKASYRSYLLISVLVITTKLRLSISENYRPIIKIFLHSYKRCLRWLTPTLISASNLISVRRLAHCKYRSQYCSVKARDAINRRLYKGLIVVETAIYRVFVLENFHQKTLTEPYCIAMSFASNVCKQS